MGLVPSLDCLSRSLFVGREINKKNGISAADRSRGQRQGPHGKLGVGLRFIHGYEFQRKKNPSKEAWITDLVTGGGEEYVIILWVDRL